MATQEPSEKGQPIKLTATWKDMPDKQFVYEVDPKTKLVERAIEFHRRGDKWEQVLEIAYLDYNKPIDPKVFTLDLPEDIITADQLSQDVGLEKGDLSEKEIAVKLVREYFEAMIAKDFAKASRMYSGLSAAKLAEGKDYINYLRIVSIGEPEQESPHRSLRVPVKVEWGIVKPFRPIIQPTSPLVRTTDAEMATKTVREFYEALIAQDYEQAARIYQEAGIVDKGFSEVDMKDLKKAFEQNSIRASRIVEIGKPVPHPESGSTEVPIKVEIEFTTKLGKEVKEFSPIVCPLEGRPDRWGIGGGI